MSVDHPPWANANVPAARERSDASIARRIIIVDGSRIDAERIRKELRRAGVSNRFRIAADLATLRGVLRSFSPDVVISELVLADADGPSVEAVVREFAPDVPLIFVSGSSYDETTASSGVADFVPKVSLFRLPSTVEAAVREARERRHLRTSLGDVGGRSRQHVARLEAIWRVVNDPAVRGKELVSVLDEAVTRLSRGLRSFGMLGHVDGAQFVIDVVAGDLGPPESPGHRLIRVGARGDAPDVIHVRDLGVGRTHSWDDIDTFPNPPVYSIEAGLRSQITTQFVACGSIYMLTIGSLTSPSTTPFGAEDYAYIEVVGSILARQLEQDRHDAAVRDADERSRRHAERLEALWRIFNATTRHGADFIDTLLREGSAAMRPLQRYGGTLGHVDGEDLIIDAIAGETGPDAGAVRTLLPVGFRAKLSDSLIGRDLAGGRTKSWDDCFALPDLPEGTRAAGIRTQITTQFRANGTLYLLSLGSLEPQTVPFSSEDHEYIEVLASMFARQIELEAAESSLRDTEVRARRHTQRLDSLWRVVNDTSLEGRDFIQAVLHEGAAALRPGLPCIGVLRHLVDGRDYIVDASAGELGPEGGHRRRLLAPGWRIDAQDTLTHSRGTRRTQMSVDVLALPGLPQRMLDVGWRSVIATSFEAAGRTYELTLGTLEVAEEVFTAEDEEYTEVLASVLARQLDLETLEGSLGQAEILARHHAERLEALWRVANNTTLHGDELIGAMLEHGARAIRPAQRFSGLLDRFEGDDVVIIAGSTDPAMQIGTRRRLAAEIVPPVGSTRGWHDLAALGADLPRGLRRMGWRSLIVTTFDAGGSRYALSFGSTEPATSFGPDDVGYLEVLASSFASHLKVDTLEVSLRDSEERSRAHAERLEALWQIVNSSKLRDEELMLAMLRQAAAAIQPGQEFEATLIRVQGEDAVIEAVTNPSDRVDADLHSRVGTVIPLANTSTGRVIAEGGGTRSWADIETTPYSSDATRARGTRAVVITTFRAGTSIWGLAFTSTRTLRSPLTAQDHAYVDVLASFFANHLQQRWQFDRIQYQQSHDVLTGLLNRSTFRSRARTAAHASARFAIVMIDVDGLHDVNESYSHMIGDAILVEIGSALRKRARDEEIVGRFGGDVFGVFIPDPPSREQLVARVVDFAEVFAHPFSTGDREGTEFVSRTACIGVAAAPEDGSQFESILSRSDAALFTAQERGYGSTVFYVAGMEAEAQRRATLHNELREAIAGDQFTLYFQPHVEIETGRVTGCEALIRWNHPTRGLLLPGHFIPFAEQTGLIANIDAWVMSNAFSAAPELAAVREGFRLYFNLSGRQAGDQKIVRAFIDAARRGLALGQIGVEITESDAMRDVDATRHVCRALRRLNVRIAIDDFGTGYSSLSSLKRLPVDLLKIDRTFVSGVLTDTHDETITETIISIADHFGIDTLAEGAEQPEEVAWLRARGCRYVQGYVVCHPLPMDEFKTWLAGR